MRSPLLIFMTKMPQNIAALFLTVNTAQFLDVYASNLPVKRTSHLSKMSWILLLYVFGISGGFPSTILYITPIKDWPSKACCKAHSSYRIHAIDLHWRQKINTEITKPDKLIQVLADVFAWNYREVNKNIILHGLY